VSRVSSGSSKSSATCFPAVRVFFLSFFISSGSSGSSVSSGTCSSASKGFPLLSLRFLFIKFIL
jgi:hypothetical protein